MFWSLSPGLGGGNANNTHIVVPRNTLTADPPSWLRAPCGTHLALRCIGVLVIASYVRTGHTSSGINGPLLSVLQCVRRVPSSTIGGFYAAIRVMNRKPKVLFLVVFFPVFSGPKTAGFFFSVYMQKIDRNQSTFGSSLRFSQFRFLPEEPRPKPTDFSVKTWTGTFFVLALQP